MLARHGAAQEEALNEWRHQRRMMGQVDRKRLGGLAWIAGLACASCASVPSASNPKKTLTGPKQLALQDQLGCALAADGAVECWAYDFDASRPQRPTERLRLRGLPHFDQLVVAPGQGCGRTGAGEVYCWEHPRIDQHPFLKVPYRRIRLAAVKRLISRDYAVCAELETGGVECWREYGFVRFFSGATVVDPPLCAMRGDELVCGRDGVPYVRRQSQDVVQLANLCTRTSTGLVRCFRGSTPEARVMRLPKVRSIAAGDEHHCAETEASELYCWGVNRYGQVTPLSTRVGFAKPVKLGKIPSGFRLEIHPRLTCLVGEQNERRCWGACTDLPELAGLRCEQRGPPAAREPACELAPLDTSAPCMPGETDGDSCPRWCDESGRWVTPVTCLGGTPPPAVYFERGSARPVASNLDGLAHRLALTRGRFYIIPLRLALEADVPNLERARAEAVRSRLIADGLCPEKLIALASGFVIDEVPRRTEPTVGVQFLIATPETAAALRREGLSVSDPLPLRRSAPRSPP